MLKCIARENPHYKRFKTKRQTELALWVPQKQRGDGVSSSRIKSDGELVETQSWSGRWGFPLLPAQGGKGTHKWIKKDLLWLSY